MKIFPKSYLTKPSGKNNEDSIGWSDELLWVIDGTTPINKDGIFSDNDAAWISSLITEKLKSLTTPFNSNLIDIMKNVSFQIKQEADRIDITWRNKEVYQLPSYAIVIVRSVSKFLDYLILGDCYLARKTAKSIDIYTDTRIKTITNKTLDVLRYNRDHVENQLKKNRSLMNKKNGYWIGDLEGTGFDMAISGRIDVNEFDEFIIFSDGFARIVDTFNLFNWSDLFGYDLDYTFNKIRELEGNDSNKTKYLRVKKSDDVSAIKFTME